MFKFVANSIKLRLTTIILRKTKLIFNKIKVSS